MSKLSNLKLTFIGFPDNATDRILVSDGKSTAITTMEITPEWYESLKKYKSGDRIITDADGVLSTDKPAAKASTSTSGSFKSPNAPHAALL